MASLSAATSLATFNNAHASSSRLPHVRLAPVHGSLGKQAIAAVNGDGVWTYDLKSLRPVASLTVPPAATFLTAPLSFVNKAGAASDDAAERVTAVGVDVEGRTELWVWATEDGDKSVVTVDSIVGVHGEAWPILVVGATGALSLLDESMALTQLAPARSQAAGRVLDSALVGSRAVLVDERGKIFIYSIETKASPTAHLAAEASLPQLLAASAGALVTAIDTSNRLHVRRLTDILEGAPAPSSSQGLALAHPSSPAVVASLPLSSNGTGRALAALATPAPAVTLVSPSVELPAVLATTSLSGEAVTHIAVIATEPRLLLAAVVSYTSPTPRSAISLIDGSLPTNGVGLASLVGSATVTTDVFRATAPKVQPITDKMLDAVSSALRAEDVERAEKAFADWLEEEDKRSPGKRAVFSDTVLRRLIDTVFSAALKDGKRTGVYAAKTISTLAERRVLADNLYTVPTGASSSSQPTAGADGSSSAPGLIVGALVPCRDDRTVSKLLRQSPVVPSGTVVTLLAQAGTGEFPSLQQTLQDVLAGPSPDPAYRANLRQLPPATAASVLSKFADWAEAYGHLDDGLGSWPEKAGGARQPLPPFSAIVTHASALLDACLPVLLDHEDDLARLANAIAPALAAQTDYRRLRAPVDAALRKHKAAAKEQAAKTDHRRRAYRNDKTTDEAVGKWRVEDFAF